MNTEDASKQTAPSDQPVWRRKALEQCERNFLDAMTEFKACAATLAADHTAVSERIRSVWKAHKTLLGMSTSAAVNLLIGWESTDQDTAEKALEVYKEDQKEQWRVPEESDIDETKLRDSMQVLSQMCEFMDDNPACSRVDNQDEGFRTHQDRAENSLDDLFSFFDLKTEVEEAVKQLEQGKCSDAYASLEDVLDSFRPRADHYKLLQIQNIALDKAARSGTIDLDGKTHRTRMEAAIKSANKILQPITATTHKQWSEDAMSSAKWSDILVQTLEALLPVVLKAETDRFA